MKEPYQGSLKEGLKGFCKIVITGLLSNQGETSINFYFIIFKEKSIKVWYSKAQIRALYFGFKVLGGDSLSWECST